MPRSGFGSRFAYLLLPLFGLAASCSSASVDGVPDAGSPGSEEAGPFLDSGMLRDVEGTEADARETTPPPEAGSGSGSYASLSSLSDGALISALHALIANHHSVGYEGAKGVMFGNGGLDVLEGKVECVYTGALFAPEKLDKGGGFNVEHSWPQSEFGGESSTAKGDMHHLFPTEKTINSCRSSNPFGNVLSPSSNCQGGGSSLGKDGAGAQVFMVRPKYRGDIARAHFYFSVRYNLHIGASEESTLRAWHAEDPPDAVESARNEAIYKIQKNRNPFVDWPEAVAKISDF